MDDLEFVRKCIRGDRLIWDEFVDKYSRLILSYVRSVLRTNNANHSAGETANDIFQEIFVLLRKDDFHKLRSFRAKNGCSLASWLRQVVINFTIDYLRRLKPAVSLDEELENELTFKDVISDQAASPSEIFIAEEKIIHLTDCIQGLDSDDRFFLELFIDKGLPLEKIKETLRISRSAVDMRKSRIINRLRDCFQSKGFVLGPAL